MGAHIKMLEGKHDAASELAHKMLRHALCAPPPDTSAHASPWPHRPEGKMHSDSLCITAHLVLAQVCKVQGRSAKALEHAAHARHLVLDRYHPSHPQAIEAQLQWARCVDAAARRSCTLARMTLVGALVRVTRVRDACLCLPSSVDKSDRQGQLHPASGCDRLFLTMRRASNRALFPSNLTVVTRRCGLA